MEAYVPEDRVGARNIVASRYQRFTRVIQIIGNYISFIYWCFIAMDQKIWCDTSLTRFIKEILLLEYYKFFQ